MSLHAKIHVVCKQLGIQENDRRDLYERVTATETQPGKRSLTQMNFSEQKLVVKELNRLGFKPTSTGVRKRLEGKYAPKLQALWIAAWNLGLIRNKSDQALLAFVKRQTKVDHTRFLRHAEDANKAIEALKGWMAREANVDWTIDRQLADWQNLSGAKIAMAQFSILQGKWHSENYHDFLSLLSVHADGCADLNLWNESNWIPVMNALGREIRAK